MIWIGFKLAIGILMALLILPFSIALISILPMLPKLIWDYVSEPIKERRLANRWKENCKHDIRY